MYARQAIVTKYIPCTNFRPSRVKAKCQAGSVTVSWDHALDSLGNHANAARTLCERFGWSGRWEAGAGADTGGYVFVQPTDGSAFTVVKPT